MTKPSHSRFAPRTAMPLHGWIAPRPACPLLSRPACPPASRALRRLQNTAWPLSLLALLAWTAPATSDELQLLPPQPPAVASDGKLFPIPSPEHSPTPSGEAAGDHSPQVTPNEVTEHVAQAWNGVDPAHRSPYRLDQLPEHLQELVRQLVLENLPNPYEDKRHWGQTTQVLDGWHLDRDGWELKTKRKWKDVNHGTWRYFRITQVDPQQNLRLTIKDLRETQPGTLQLTVELRSRMQAHARLSRWRWGVQTLSLSIDADAEAVVRVVAEATTQLDFQHLPPDVVFRPVVTAGEVELPYFEVQRISKIEGKAAEELGRGLREVLEERLESERPKLVARINRQIQKHPERLRFSLHALMQDGWQRWVQPENSPPTTP